VNILPAPSAAGSTWEIRIPGAYNGPDRVMTITKLN
jgi:hypothetical protein